MCAEQVPLEAKVCEYCGTKFEMIVEEGKSVSRFLEEPIAPPEPSAQTVPPPMPAVAPKQISPWVWVAAGLGLLLILALVGGGILVAQNFENQQSSPFVGEWSARDLANRSMQLTITMDNSGTHHVTWFDKWATYCDPPQTYLATGRVDSADPNLLQVYWIIDCADASYRETGVSKYYYQKDSDTIEEVYEVNPGSIWRFTWHRTK